MEEKWLWLQLEEVEDKINQVNKGDEQYDKTENPGSDKITAYGKQLFHMRYFVN
jgi:hypothetical protein